MFSPINPKTGEKFQLTWQYTLLRISGAWPPKSGLHWTVHTLYNFYTICCILAFCIFIIGSLYFILKEQVLNYKLQCIIIEIAILTCLFRILDFIYRRNDFKSLLNKFYFEIFIPKEQQGAGNIALLMKLIEFMCISYNLSFLWFATQPAVSYYLLGFEDEPLPNRILKVYAFEGYLAITLAYFLVIWVTMSTATYMAVESYLLGFYLVHLFGRFKNLNDEILLMFDDITKPLGKIPVTNDGKFLNSRLRIILKKHEQLKLFGEMLHKNFTVRYFLLVLSSGILMCLVVFIISEGSQYIFNLMFVFWAIAAVIEQMAVGYIGSELLDLTENMSRTFYCCEWEKILLNPEITNEAKKLFLNDLWTAMLSSTKPIKITGLGFFDLSIVTAFNTVRTAISYFMFLNTMKNAPET